MRSSSGSVVDFFLLINCIKYFIDVNINKEKKIRINKPKRGSKKISHIKYSDLLELWIFIKALQQETSFKFMQ